MMVNPPRLETADDLEKPLRLLLAQGGGRLVENQQLRLVRQRLRDGDQLPLGDGQVAGESGRPDIDAKLGEDGLGPAVHFAPVDQPAPFRQIVSEQDILRRRQIGADRDLLVDDADAGGAGGERVGERDLAPLEADRALVGRKDSAADADQGRLPGAVLADEGMHLAAGHGEAHPLQGAHTPEALAHAVEFDDRRRHRFALEGIAALKGEMGEEKTDIDSSCSSSPSGRVSRPSPSA